MKDLVGEWFDKLANVGTLPSDTEDERLCKSILTFAATLIVVLAVFWVTVYALLGFWISAAIPLVYQIISVASLIWFFRTKRYRAFRFSQLAMMLLLPFLLQWSLGGFVVSSGVMLWALISPLGAVLFQGPKHSVPWFIGYLLLTGASAAADGYLSRNAVPMPPVLIVVFFAMNITGVSVTVYLLTQYFARRREEALAALQAEQARSERLLLNVLPAPIAQRLKRNPGVIADAFDDVSILFADIVGFTTLSERVSPEEIVPWLNEVFSDFDRLARRCGLEKIRTIGDSYMAVAGVPLPHPDHVGAVAEMALNMLDAVSGRKAPNGDELRIRIGLNTGHAVGAVVGLDKFIYDVYGDAVNTASRMESHGLPGHIQVTEVTYRRLRDRYLFEERQTMQVKGKGEMVVYLLVGRKDAQPANVSGAEGGEVDKVEVVEEAAASVTSALSR
jgi:adenylate cyclase